MMFTDIVGSSLIKRLLGQSEAEQDRAWVERFQRSHHEIIRGCIARHGGEEIKTIGDAFFVTFDDPVAGVRCATEIQRELSAAHLVTPLPGEPALEVRIGLHTSRPVRQGRDYVGTSVDLTARVESAAVGGQILISQQTHDLVAAAGTPEIVLYEQGEFPLKGMGVHTLHEVVWNGCDPRRTGQRELRQYCEAEKTRLLAERAPGIRNLRVRDAVAGDLFISPPWKDDTGRLRSDDVCGHLLSCLSDTAGSRVILLGSPGQGKTTVLKRLFVLLCERFCSGESRVVPLYIPLRECCHTTLDAFGSREWLWGYLRNDASTRLPLDFEQFNLLVSANRLVFLLDGFDEMGLATQAAVNQVVRRPVFSLPAVLTCRRNYYELYLRASPIQERYSEEIDLAPWDMAGAGRRYVNAFALFRNLKSAHTLLDTILRNEDSLELAKRPLLLTMMLDVIASAALDDDPDATSHLAGLYEADTDNWRTYEAVKPGSVLTAEEKSLLLESLAWSLYVTRRSDAEAYGDWCSGTVCRRNELQAVVENHAHLLHGRPAGDVVEDLRLRSFLAEDRRDRISFLHVSFQEYFVARHIFEQIGRGADEAAAVLRELIPLPVGLFLLDLLEPRHLPLSGREQISLHLIEAAERHRSESEEAIHIREHAVFYLSRLGTERGRRFLESEYPREPNQVIQRSMMVGLALFWKRPEITDEYVRLLLSDSQAAEVNLGYHLVYFGDQPRQEGFRDAGRSCDRTVAGILRHLKEPEIYEAIWPLDLLTLRTLVERRGPDLLSPADCAFVRTFLEERAWDGEAARQVRALARLIHGSIYERAGKVSV